MSNSKHMLDFSNYKIFRYVRNLAVLLAFIVPNSSYGADAVICTYSSDNQVSSLMGTDFDPGAKVNSPYYQMGSMMKNTPVGIEIYPDESTTDHHAGGFYDQLASFDGNPDHYAYAGTNFNAYKSKYITTNKLHELFPNGNGKPFGWPDGQNSFYVSAANPNGYICGVWFPWELFKGRKFSLSYRFYVIESDVTKLPELSINPVLTIGAHNACGGYNGVESVLTNDKGDKVIFPAGNGVDLSSLPNGYKKYSNSHGTFDVPDVNVGYNVTYNISFVDYNTSNFDNLMYYPFLNCYNAGQYRIVVDYINISMEHLCVDKDSVCPGQDFNVTAIDYPLDAYLEWEYCVNYDESKVIKDSKGNITADNNLWVKFDEGYYESKKVAKLSVPIDVNFLDKIRLRTHQTKGTFNSDINLTGGYSLPLTVTVADVKKCTPAPPDVDVHNICAPNSSLDVFSVVDPNEIADYNWKLIGPDGVDYTSTILAFDDTKDPHHHTATIKAVATSPNGLYTLEVFGRNGLITEASSATRKFTFTIYQTPNLNILLRDDHGAFIDEGDKLCPSPLKMLKYTALLSGNDPDYKYTWTNAQPVFGAEYSATINVGVDADKFCSGDLNEFNVSAKINNHGCIGDAQRKFTVEAPAGPFIECNKLTIPDLELEPTKDVIDYTFTLPAISSQCGETPKVDVAIVGPDGSAITAKVVDNKVTATYPMGISTVTITATDDCGNTATCVKKVTVKDVTPPNVDCDELAKNYSFTTRLSYYGGACFATPGEGSNPEKLPVITDPTLEDRDHPGVKIKGSFVSRSDAKDVNDPYSVGVTTIEWSFKDDSGNESLCHTTVTVIDDTKPVVNCTSTGDVLNVNTDEDECKTSVQSVWDQLIEKMGAEPSAKLNCSSSDITIVTTVYIKSETDAKYHVFGKDSDESFEKDVTYSMLWSFKKNSANVNVDADSSVCEQFFKVVDSEQPEVTCGASSSYVITVNYKKNDPNYVYKYASGKISDVNTQYTATSIIEQVPTATDNCGPVTMVVTVDSANAETHPILTITGTKQQVVDKLRPFEFMQFTTTTITYTFTDGSGNSSECVKSISVIDRTVPVAKCFTPDEISLYADDNCQGTYDGVTLEKIKKDHMATMAFTRYTTTYRWDRGPANPAGAWVIKPGPNNPSQSTITYANEVAPSTITRQHYVKNAEGEYVLDKTDIAYAKPGLHKDGGSYKIAKIQVDKFEVPAGPAGMGAIPRADETSKYRMVPTVGTQADGVAGHYVLVNEDEVLNTKFELGKTVLTIWYTNGDLYENDKFVEKGDSTPCEVTIIVEDTIAPKINCDVYANLTYHHNLTTDDCTWPFDLPIPTLELLKAKDNCTDAENLKLSYIRRFEGKDEELEEDFKIGTTSLTWVVTDESGNKATCENKIEVEDKKGPEFDCDKVTPKNITAFANGDCAATFADLKDLGLVTPKSKNDACSPIGTADSIYAEGSRSDGLILTSPYPKENSPITITWTVKDAFGNASTCEQVIEVVDTTAPSIVCDMEDLEFEIKGESCSVPGSEVEAEFTKHVAKDNCDGEIEGVPGTGVNGADPLLENYPIGTTVVTWVFTDKSGVSAYCPQNVIVKDNINPDPSDICPKDPFEANAVPGTCEANVSLPELTLFDKCDDDDLVGVFKRADSETLTKDDAFPVGETSISWTFTDKSGNIGICVGNVIVKDVTPPNVYCNYAVNDSLLFQMTLNECGAASSKIVEQVQIPYAFDECDNKRIDDYTSEIWFYGLKGNDAPVKQVDSDGNPIRWDDPNYVYQPGYTHLLFIFTDAAGNTDKCDFTVIVKDNTPPSVDCDQILSPYPVYPDKDECEVTLASVDLNELNNVKAYDHCPDEFGNIVEYEGKPYNPSTDQPFELDHSLVLKAGEKVTIWWKYESPKGGTSLCIQDIQAIDTQAPVIDCSKILPIDTTADAEKCHVGGAEIAELLKPYPVASDNCGDIEGVPTRNDGKDLDAEYPTGTTIITWTFADSNPENTVTCEQKVFVKGSIPPEINCDTFRTYHDTIPDCVTRPLAIRTPYAIDVCAPDSIVNMVPGVPTRSDGKDINDPYPLGNTIITWTFTDFTGAASSSCNDTVNVRTKEEMIISCVEPIKPDMEEGECDYQVTVPVATAKHPCLDITFPGTPYIKGSTKPLPVVDGKLDYKFHVGNYTVLWVFVDSTTNSLVKSVDTCSTDVQIGNKNQMPVDCDNYPAIKKALTGNCSIDAADLGFNDPEVVDLCTGKTIIPYIYRVLRDKPADTLTANQLGEFKVGEQDTIVRVFSFKSEGQIEGSSLECRQPVWILDSLNIKTNCVPEDSITTLAAEDGKCELNISAVLDSLGTPEATDECLDHTIPGKPFIYKEGVLNPIKGDEVVEVGKITIIRWLFNDPLANIDTAYCDQKVTAKSNAVPIFDCSTLDTLPFIAKGECFVDLTDADIPTPVAIDSCTHEEVKGAGVRASGNPLYGKYKVGYDTIVWTFTSPNSFESKSCEQIVYVRSDNEPKFNCDDLPDTTLLADGECELPVDKVLEMLGDPIAREYCTDSLIHGVPTLVNGDPLPATFPVGKTVTIRWTFSMPEFTIADKICDQDVTINGNAAPKFDCSTLDTLPFVAKGECSIDLQPLDIPVPEAKDGCDEDAPLIPGVPTRKDGGDVYGTYPVGGTTITWTFKSSSSTEVKTCDQVVWVKTDLQLNAECGEEKYPDIPFVVDNGDCTIDPESVLAQLTNHEVFNPCNNTVKAVVDTARSDGKPMNAPYEIGVTTITWTFTDTTNTLVNPTSSCEQTVTVTDHNDPVIECPVSFPAATIYLDDENCTADLTQIPVFLDTIPYNPCSKELAEVDTTRLSGKGIHDPFEVGVDTIKWYFRFPSTGRDAFCLQRVEVIDTIAPNFDCDALTDTIKVEITTSGESVPYSEVVDAGFYVPVVTDKCSDITTTVKRSDGVDYQMPYPIDATTVTFTFTDDHGNSKSCSQVIQVLDMIPPTVDCPALNMPIACAGDTTPAYKTYEEFKLAGGSVSDESRIDPTSFRHTDVIEGDVCQATITRDYFFTTIRGVIVHCTTPQVFNVNDNEAPTYEGLPTEGMTRVTTCNALDIEPPVITAVDNCDPNPVIKMDMVSTQDPDPEKCEHYNYEINYSWVASDRCGNVAETVSYKVIVRDTAAPHVNVPEDWYVEAHPVYGGNCQFFTPNIEDLIPRDSIRLDCGDSRYVKFRQEPVAGIEVTESIEMKLYITTVCGNDTVLTKQLIVQPRKQIISVETNPTTLVCGDDESLKHPRSATNSLANDAVRVGRGDVYIEIAPNYWDIVPTTMNWEYYRDSIAPENLIFATDTVKYGNRFSGAYISSDATPEEIAKADSIYASYNLLLRRTQSGRYAFVITDTVTGCLDTGYTYIDVRERPRLALESGEWNICSGDSLTLMGDYGDAFPVCVNDMGTEITAEGWMVNDSVYKPLDSIFYENGKLHTGVYYATNECGTSTTMNSLFITCDGDLETAEDSLKAAGSQANYALMKADKLITRDSVKINVYTTYDPAQILLTTYPQDKPRVWIGEEAEIKVQLPYDNVSIYKWMQVVGEYDARDNALYNRYGEIVEGGSNEDDDIEIDTYYDPSDTTHIRYIDRATVLPTDSSLYYVVVGNGVCPSVSSNVVAIDVLDQLPTAITPYTKDGMNDVFMPRHHVIIFNRYGQMIFEGKNGWDGTYRGILADPGVYYYEVVMNKNGFSVRGAIEVVKFE